MVEGPPRPQYFFFDTFFSMFTRTLAIGLLDKANTGSELLSVLEILSQGL